ncbi:hypothetical protein ES705_24228 [subsurface metagenome]
MNINTAYIRRKSGQGVKYIFGFLLVLYVYASLPFLTELNARPHIEMLDQQPFLSVHGQPFIVMSIEDHRTTGFDGDIREEFFKTAKQLYANALSVTFRWSYFEKQEGQYDTTILRNIKTTADKYGLKVVIIWFGTNMGGHGNSAPEFILEDSITYIPYTRSDKSFATGIGGLRTNRIYCYSFDDKNKNQLLLKERKALQALMYWIRTNDLEQTFIMLQLENELCVHPELWRPWPPVGLPRTQLSQEENKHLWNSTFQVQSCSLRIITTCDMVKNGRVEFALTDTTGKQQWNGHIETAGMHEFHIGGEFINTKCQMMVRTSKSDAETTRVYNTIIMPIAERCYCRRCNEIYDGWNFQSDQHFQQAVFINYINNLASAIAEIDADFPLYLNVLVNYDAKTRLGNPYYNPEDWMNAIPNIDFICPDIYFESKIAVMDTFNFGRNIIFIPEAGHLKSKEDQDYLNAFSLIFLILGKYQGIGIQVYDLKGSKFGLLSLDGQWKKNAYLVRNSYSAISQLPSALFVDVDKHSISGFRNVAKKIIQLGAYEITVTPITAPKYTRGIIAKKGENLVFCGIGFEARIMAKNINSKRIKIERGYWKKNRYISLGKLKPNTCEIGKDFIIIKMDEDDFSPPDIFNPAKNQYYIKISLN